MYEFILSLVCAYVACIGFCFIFHIRGKLLYITPIGGVIIWAVYLLLENAVPEVIVRTLFSTMAAALFCEIIARVMKVPVTVFMIIAILPLVPGSGIYYTMLACVARDYDSFLSKGVETIGIAGALAAGILMVSSLFKMSTSLIRYIKTKEIS